MRESNVVLTSGPKPIRPENRVSIDKWELHDVVNELFGLAAVANAIDTGLQQDLGIERVQQAMIVLDKRLSAIGMQLGERIPGDVAMPDAFVERLESTRT